MQQSTHNLIQVLNNLQNNSLISLDYETCLTDGSMSVEMYRDDFRVKTAAIAVSPTSAFVVSKEADILSVLSVVAEKQLRVVVHNLNFECSVTRARFPSISLNWYADTMRMVQNADNGNAAISDETEDDDTLIGEEKPGISLSAALSRWLPSLPDHKKTAYDLIKSRTDIKTKKYGQLLHLLTEDELVEYNGADATATLALFFSLEEFFKSVNFDYRYDHDIYIEMCKLTGNSKIYGVKVDRQKIVESINSLQESMDELWEEFVRKGREAVEKVEEENAKLLLGKYKTGKKRQELSLELMNDKSKIKFNINSSKQKEMLFVDVLKITPKFFTPAGKPSFKKSVLGQWGELGLLLQKRGTLLVAHRQAVRLHEKSSYDGRWHIDISPAGTTTGRMKGGGGLNVQAMSRREPLLMSAVVADPGHVFVSVDLSAGEPTIITEYSKDPYYKKAVFDCVGKPPEYDANGVLCIGDIYLMGMSVSPIGRAKLSAMFHSLLDNGRSFKEQWVDDSEYITKNLLKKDRELHKNLILGIGYEMGGDKMVESSYEKGFSISPGDAKGFIKAWWGLMKDVNLLRKRMKAQLEREGFLINQFGYRLVPDKSYKALNYYIQSSVNGIINVLCIKFFSFCKFARFITIIHDELIFQCPKNKEKEAKEMFTEVLKTLNDELGWDVKIQTGFVKGINFYEAK